MWRHNALLVLICVVSLALMPGGGSSGGGGVEATTGTHTAALLHPNSAGVQAARKKVVADIALRLRTAGASSSQLIDAFAEFGITDESTIAAALDQAAADAEAEAANAPEDEDDAGSPRLNDAKRAERVVAHYNRLHPESRKK